MKLSWLHKGSGVFWLLAAALFLVCNSALMHEGAMAFANSDRLKLILGAVAVSTPWILAMLPFQAGISMRRGWRGIRHPTSATLVVVAAYVVFIAYNVLNGSNALTSSRVSIVAEKQKGVEDVQAVKDKRAALLAQQKNIPPFRPADTVWALIEAEKQSKKWKSTAECSKATNEQSRKFCANIQTLEAEAASAEKGATLQASIDDLDAKLAGAGAVSSETDPQAEAIARVFSTSPANVRASIGMLGPIALEFGALVFLAFAGKALGWVKPHSAAASPEPVELVQPVALIPSPEVLKSAPVASLDALTAQRKLCEWFFRNCWRPVASGAMPESEWFDHYLDVCRHSNDTPLPLEAFRRIASNYIAKMHPVDGIWHYFECLPVVPQHANENPASDELTGFETRTRR